MFVSPICKPEISDLSYESVADIAYTFDCNRDLHSDRSYFIQSSTLLGINLIKKGRLERIESTREKIIEEFAFYNSDRGVGAGESAVSISNIQNRLEDFSRPNQ